MGSLYPRPSALASLEHCLDLVSSGQTSDIILRPLLRLAKPGRLWRTEGVCRPRFCSWRPRWSTLRGAGPWTSTTAWTGERENSGDTGNTATALRCVIYNTFNEVQRQKQNFRLLLMQMCFESFYLCLLKGKGCSLWGFVFSPRKNSGFFLKIFRIAE